MIAKKTKSADLEKKRFAFFQIGLVLSGAITLVAFEYTTVEAEKKKMTEVIERSTWSQILEIPEEIIEKPEIPQPKKTSMQTEPTDEVEISNKKIGNSTFTKIVINDPCDDCEVYIPIIPEKDVLDDPLIGAQVMPSFPGGEAAMMEFVMNRIKIPQINIEMGKGGMVYVNFVVNQDGSISDVEGTSDSNIELIKAAESVVKSMPTWIPGENYGKKVRVRYTIPINIKIG